MLTIAQLFDKSGSLPAMPEVARRLLASFNEEDADLRPIISGLRSDPALAAKVLRLANSARYGLTRRIESVDSAVALLGVDALRTLVVSACLVNAFPRIPHLDRVSFWEHSLANGGYARWLAKPLGYEREVAYLAGFTVRIGQLLMAQAAPTDMAAVEKRLSTPGERWAREFELTGITHAAATAELASRWGFPERLVSAFASATAPLESRPFSVLAAIVCLSTHLADAGEFDVPFDDIIASLPAGLCDHLRLDLADWSAELPTYDALADVAASLG